MSFTTPSMERALGELAGCAVSARLAGHGRPFVIGLFITHRCMCSCQSCLWKHNDWKDVPTADLKRFLAEARDEGFRALAISGGEPFLRKDLGEVVRFAKEQLDMTILVFTTGYFLEKRGAEVLPWLDMLLMSIDAPNATRHDAIRGLPGLFDTLMRASDLVKRDYPQLSAQYNSCLQKGCDVEHLDDLIELAERKEMRISFDVITQRRNAGEEAFTETDMGLPPDELAALCRHIVARKRTGAPIVNSERYFQYFANGQGGYRCHLPKMAMMVDGRGYVENCLDLNDPIANIRDLPVRDILALPRFKALRSDAERCSTCSSPTMVDMSNIWENPRLVLRSDGLVVA